jgi:quercetin 2,3-dioxygenase
MFQIRRRGERGHFDHGWLNTYHTFSFGEYYDPDQMGFRALRVINEDWVQPAMGFGMHGHRDMEIVTCVLEGALEHRDSLGNGEVLRPGEFQRMSAGTGIRHSEFNPSSAEPVHLYQIWLLPKSNGITPGYEQKQFPEGGRLNQWQLVASNDGAQGSLTIHQDAQIFLAKLEAGHTLTYSLKKRGHAWIQVLRGSVQMQGTLLEAGDGVAISDEAAVTVVGEPDADVMLFDLA